MSDTPPDQATQEELDKILDMVTDGCVVPSYIAESKIKAKAALLALMYRERIDELKAHVLSKPTHISRQLEQQINDRIKELEAATQRYGQEGGDGTGWRAANEQLK